MQTTKHTTLSESLIPAETGLVVGLGAGGEGREGASPPTAVEPVEPP